MTIQVPWKTGLNSRPYWSLHGIRWWNRKKQSDDSGPAHSSILLKEDDLDHLGKLHQAKRQKI